MSDKMLEKIYGSTLYKASKNKDAIKSALENPVNMELVQQLREYLDDDVRRQLTQKPIEFDEPGMFSGDIEGDDFEPDEGFDDGGDSNTSSPSPSPRPASFTSKADHFEDLKDFEESGDTPAPISEDSSSDDAKPAAETDTSSVESSTMIQTKLDLDALQGTLNAREDTAGVSYILQKDDELWIHYNDKTNLNNVMETVITLIRDLGYDNLNFNRLARSANAIVFEIVVTNINNYTMASKEEK